MPVADILGAEMPLANFDAVISKAANTSKRTHSRDLEKRQQYTWDSGEEGPFLPTDFANQIRRFTFQRCRNFGDLSLHAGGEEVHTDFRIIPGGILRTQVTTRPMAQDASQEERVLVTNGALGFAEVGDAAAWQGRQDYFLMIFRAGLPRMVIEIETHFFQQRPKEPRTWKPEDGLRHGDLTGVPNPQCQYSRTYGWLLDGS